MARRRHNLVQLFSLWNLYGTYKTRCIASVDFQLVDFSVWDCNWWDACLTWTGSWLIKWRRRWRRRRKKKIGWCSVMVRCKKKKKQQSRSNLMTSCQKLPCWWVPKNGWCSRTWSIMNQRLGGAQPGNRFVYFVHVCIHTVWLPSGIGSQILWAGLFSFPFCPGLIMRLFFFCLGWSQGAFPFPFSAQEFSLFPSPTPQTSYPTLVGLIISNNE